MGGDRACYWQVHLKFRERLAWDLVEKGFRQLNSTHSQQLRSLPPPPVPQANGRYCPGITPSGNNSHSRSKGYITKHTLLLRMRKDPVLHQLIQNETMKTPQLCILCRFLSKAVPGSSNYNAFISAPDGPHGTTRRTNFVCSYCLITDIKVPLCKSFCFQFFHNCC